MTLCAGVEVKVEKSKPRTPVHGEIILRYEINKNARLGEIEYDWIKKTAAKPMASAEKLGNTTRWQLNKNSLTF
jgi:hypothetical protein